MGGSFCSLPDILYNFYSQAVIMAKLYKIFISYVLLASKPENPLGNLTPVGSVTVIEAPAVKMISVIASVFSIAVTVKLVNAPV